jgi:hypothetical protein
MARFAGLRPAGRTVAGFGHGRQHDCRQMSKCGLAPHAPTQFISVHFRHLPVGDDEPWHFAQNFVQRFRAVLREYDVMPAAFQSQLKRPEVIEVVVDEQDGGHGL